MTVGTAAADVFSRLPSGAREMLECARAALKTCELESSQQFAIERDHCVASAHSERLLAEIGKFSPKGITAIYYFQALKDVNLEACREAFKAKKGELKQKRAMARCGKNISQTLYVGSSQNLRKRIAEHLGVGSKSTYALHLSCWAGKHELPLTLHCATYTPVTHPAAAQALEDALWDELTPMFGRRGAR